MQAQEVVAAIRQALERNRTNPFRASLKAGLPGNAIRYVLEGRQPRLNRLIDICNSLGLEFYVGPPRDEAMLPTSNKAAEKSPPTWITALREEVPTLIELCNSLGLKFYVGPSADDATALTSNEASTERPPAWVASLRDEIVRQEAATRAAMSEMLSRLQLPPSQDELADDGALAQPVMATDDKADEVPGARPVEVRELAAAAGGGSQVDTETVTGSLWFRRDWLERHALDPNQCSVIRVTGESMEPTLEDGCSILVNRAQRRRRVGHLFAVRTDEGLIAKRAGKNADGKWLLVSDHPGWPSAPWPKDAPVIGEVRWKAKTLLAS